MCALLGLPVLWPCYGALAGPGRTDTALKPQCHVSRRPLQKHNAAVERALDGLRYGSVCLNTWSVFGYAAMQVGRGWHVCLVSNVVHSVDAKGWSWFGWPMRLD